MKVISALAITLLSTTLYAQVQHEWKWKALAKALVERLDPQPGEEILLLCAPDAFEPMRPHLRHEIMLRGAVELGCLESLPTTIPASWDLETVRASLERSRQAFGNMLGSVDAVVKILALPPDPVYLAAQDLLREGHGRTIHFHWEGAYPVPGHLLPPQGEIDGVYQKAVLETDYDGLAKVQAEFEEAMRGAVVRITTPEGTDLQFQIGDRPVTRQDGDASAARAAEARNLIDREIEIPAGAVRVAPIEDSVQGVIVFPVSAWNGESTANVRLTIENGRVTGAQAEEGLAAVQAELDSALPASRSFREFALGFNPLLAVPERFPWIPYYGYGAGVVRLSLGDNTELGGDVGGGYVRWNFFTNATVQVGDEIWVRDGRLTR